MTHHPIERRQLAVVTAGLSQPSSTRLLADRLTEAVRRHVDVDGAVDSDVDVRVIELRGLANDIAHNMLTGFPAHHLRDAIDSVTGADGLIAVTPVFTGSYSGLFKSFFDIVDKDALAGTPVLAAATGGTARHSLVLEHAMRPLFAYLRAIVVPTAVYAASEDWGTADSGSGNGSSSAIDGTLAARIDRAGAELAALMNSRPSRPAQAGGATADADTGADTDAGTDAGADDEVVPFAEQLAALGVRG
ncbi:FMN reductase [Streptomyces sp. CBMA29]|uniref:FMN reductase n=1 Tax=Streptomyces sp. CBMA29 TaxID=1896314 RepID=UPI001661DC0E|nr:FMN reductase [Streptomyces sp. CBMA29]MBD0734431.1 oxidoreductase [Streptomyces sp. CBMA29]